MPRRTNAEVAAATRESTIEDYLKRAVKKRGGEVRKVKWIGRRSAPDRLVMMPGISFFIELKRPGKKPTDAQGREHLRMRASGLRVHWASTKSEIDTTLWAINKALQ